MKGEEGGNHVERAQITSLLFLTHILFLSPSLPVYLSSLFLFERRGEDEGRRGWGGGGD